jgi:hypothetical protein
MNHSKKNVVVIGAGIHGLTIALELAKHHDVTIVDANNDILMGASNGTHNRIHLGYHYPRSTRTIAECKSGYDFFVKNYMDCLVFPDFYYMIEKQSMLTAQEYRNVMVGENLPCDSEFPDTSFLNRTNIEDSFKVKEACFDILKFREVIRKQLADSNIKQHMSFNIAVATNQGNQLVLVDSNNHSLLLNADLIVNCTYTYSNNLLNKFGIATNLTDYEFEQTEVAVVECDFTIPAMTVMDGPFISILPYGNHKNTYLVYDVVNSVRNRECGLYFNRMDCTKESNWKKMLEHGLEYYPFFNKLKYKYSLYSHRPIPKNNEGDSRTTRIVKEDYAIDFFSIKEGKFISAPSIAQIFAEMVNSNA